MTVTLNEANRRRAYTITDRATYLASRGHLQLRVLIDNNPLLVTPIDVILVNPKKWHA
jgi:tungstate transport system substrate-binding protein